jgi:hypothetical protein
MKYDYFIGEISIPHLIGDEANNEAVKETVDDLITDYETEFLKLLFGYENDCTMYNDYLAGIAAGTAKWTSLQTQIYNETSWRSPAAYYIFYKWLQQSSTVLTSMGDVKQADGQNFVTSSKRLVRVWNRMVDMVNDVWDWIEDDDDRSYHAYDYNWQREDAYVSDHNHKLRSPFEKINQFGI